MAEIQLGAVEARFADIIWEREPVTSAELIKLAAAELTWKRTTTHLSLIHIYRSDLLSALCPLRLHDTYRSSINEEGVVHFACAGWELPHSYAHGREQIQIFHILNDPARSDQLLVYRKTGLFLW